jgi:hypothetical protein
MNFRNVRVILSATELLGLRAVNTNDAQLVRSRNEGAEGALFRMRSQ